MLLVRDTTAREMPVEQLQHLHCCTTLEILLDLHRILVVGSLDLLVELGIVLVDVIHISILLERTSAAVVFSLGQTTHTHTHTHRERERVTRSIVSKESIVTCRYTYTLVSSVVIRLTLFVSGTGCAIAKLVLSA
jgi:hypothetical protein